ncbi:MAG: CRISPR-associated endonuclease Cas1 [Nitrospirae bacterium]|nr:CRISPR-associated endonuclease Cas1 [Nitrospirota bacterium]
MERTLYLNENKGLRVFRDGPSVWIREEGKAGRRIPARLVGRVVIIGNIKLEAGVITLFTDNDIPVTFLNYRGDVVAVAMPYNHHLPRHYEEQKKFLETEENIERFRSWIYSKRKETQLSVIKRISKRTAEIFSEKGFKEKDYKKFIDELKPSHLTEEKFKSVYGTVSNLFREMAIGCIVRADLDPHLGVYYRRHNFGFALDICHVLEAEIEIQTIQFLKIAKDKCQPKAEYIMKDSLGWLITKEGMRDIVHRFENRRKELQERVERLLDDVFELMRELRK